MSVLSNKVLDLQNFPDAFWMPWHKHALPGQIQFLFFCSAWKLTNLPLNTVVFSQHKQLCSVLTLGLNNLSKLPSTSIEDFFARSYLKTEACEFVGNWLPGALWMPCPDGNWCCGAGAAHVPVHRKLQSLCFFCILQHLLTSPSSSQNCSW